MNVKNDIIFIRHGENINNDLMFNNDLPLSALGIKQANASFKILFNKFDIIICSISKRAIMTAKIIGPNSKIIYDERLLERGWGNNNKDGLETDGDAKIRIYKLLKEAIEKFDDKRILFVTHGALIKLIQDVVEDNSIKRSSIDNCDIIIYQKNGEKLYIKNKIH